MTTTSNTPAVFLPYQQRVCEDSSRIRVIEKSRRIGLSWALAGASVLEAAGSEGWNVYYAGYNLEMAQQFITDAALFARAYNLGAAEIEETVFEDTEQGGETKKILTYVIRFASGFGVHALSSHPRNFRSRQGHAIIDEAAFHPDLAGMLKAAIAFLMWGRGRVTIVSSHNGVNNPFNQLCEDIRKGRKKYSPHRITFDDACADGLYERICLRNHITPTPEGYQDWRQGMIDDYGDFVDEELFCVPSSSGGSYIPRALVEDRSYDAPVVQLEKSDEFAHLPESVRNAEVLEWCNEHVAPLIAKLSKDEPHVLGEDFGRASDLTVLAPMAITKKLVRRVPFLLELRNVPYKQQEQIVYYLLDRLPRFCKAAFDAGGNGNFLAEVAVQRYGESIIEAVNCTDKWYAENLPPFKAAFEDKLILIPRDMDVLQDISMLKVINGLPKLPKLRTIEIRAIDRTGEKRKRHGDAAIALAMAYHASRREVKIEYKAIKSYEQEIERPLRLTNGLRTGRGGLL